MCTNTFVCMQFRAFLTLQIYWSLSDSLLSCFLLKVMFYHKKMLQAVRRCGGGWCFPDLPVYLRVWANGVVCVKKIDEINYWINLFKMTFNKLPSVGLLVSFHQIQACCEPFRTPQVQENDYTVKKNAVGYCGDLLPASVASKVLLKHSKQL